MHGKACFSIVHHEKHVKMHSPGSCSIRLIWPAVKMHGKSCFSIAAHENHVKMNSLGSCSCLLYLSDAKNDGKLVDVHRTNDIHT